MAPRGWTSVWSCPRDPAMWRSKVEQGAAATLFFVVQMADVESVAPNDRTHPAFGEALRQAARAGVQVLAWDCDVTPESIRIRRPVPVILEG